MTPAQVLLLSATGQKVLQLFGDRDDLVVGITAVFLDLYRVMFTAGFDSKNAALSRLKAQYADLEGQIPGGRVSKYLDALIAALEADRLDAAKLLREPVVGSA
jgi:hypothetical protein